MMNRMVIDEQTDTYRIKTTQGITAWYYVEVRILHNVRDLDVDSIYPSAATGAKGSAVLRLKDYVSWVNTAVRQVGLYLLNDRFHMTSYPSTRGLDTVDLWFIFLCLIFYNKHKSIC